MAISYHTHLHGVQAPITQLDKDAVHSALATIVNHLVGLLSSMECSPIFVIIAKLEPGIVPAGARMACDHCARQWDMTAAYIA